MSRSGPTCGSSLLSRKRPLYENQRDRKSAFFESAWELAYQGRFNSCPIPERRSSAHSGTPLTRPVSPLNSALLPPSPPRKPPRLEKPHEVGVCEICRLKLQTV